MRKNGWSCLILGFLVTIVSCRSFIDDNGTQFIEPAATISSTAVAQQPTATNKPKPTPTPPAKPTPAPTSNFLHNWEFIGDESNGMRLAMPADWADMSGDIQLDTTALNSQFGLISLFAANNPRTGMALLAGKEIQNGAFAAGLLLSQPLPAEDAFSAMEMMLADLQAENRMVSEITPVSLAAGDGVYVDVLGNPALFPEGAGQNLVTRIYLLPGTSVDGETGPVPAMFIFSTTLPDWERYLPLFAQMADSIEVFGGGQDVVLSEGRLVVAGELENGAQVNGRLDAAANDIWTLNVTDPVYVSLILRPEADNLDLILTLIDPSGQTMMSVDNGFAGDTETANDVLLTQTGIYVVAVSDFFEEGGRYNLTATESTTPLHSGGGRIEPGQGIQSEIGANGRQYWIFEGAAGTLISIVVEPDARLDAVLNLFGPDGAELAGLDEGFSGDAELLSGFELPVTGEYTIQVSSFGANSGAYTISLGEGGEDTANFYDAGDLVYGDNRQETLQAYEAHTWFFEGKTGDEVVVELEPLDPALDLEVWLLDQELNRLAVADEFLQGEGERLTVNLPADGQYLILARDFNGVAGDYVIRLAAMVMATPEPRGTLLFGETVTGSLDMGETAVYYFDARQNETIHIELSPISPESDFAFTLLGPNGRAVQQVDNESTGKPEAFATTLPESGLWGIVISEFFDEGGDYALTISK
jgi:hypothetical protein